MHRLTLADRFAAAAFGAFFGALIGLALAWIVGVYSNTIGPSYIPVNFKHWVGYCALGFGTVGLVAGPFVGDLIGHVINAIFKFEGVGGSEETEAPTWLIVAILFAIVGTVWWSAT